MSSKIIIIAVAVLLIASFAALFVIETKNHDYDYKKAWSVVYFENPRDDSLDFAIENHEGADAKYGYQIFSNENKLIEGEIDVKAGATQKISPVLQSEKIQGTRVTIDVKYKDTDYKIYKDLGK
jgi:hypothetical protein